LLGDIAHHAASLASSIMIHLVVSMMALSPAGRAEILPKPLNNPKLMAAVSPSVTCRARVGPRANGPSVHEEADGTTALHETPPAVFLSARAARAKSKAASFSDTPPPAVQSICKAAAVAASRRTLLRGAFWAAGLYYGSGGVSCASAYTVKQVKPDEQDTYARAQNFRTGPLRVLWVGAGSMKGVTKNLFSAGNEVLALDLLRPDATDMSAATTYAREHGYELRFEQGDATKLNFAEGTFDVVVCSMFLCQDFDPEVVVSEIRRVLKPGGRFGFYEHVEDIDSVIVGKVFGERSVVRVEAYPERLNIMAGVVRKI